MALQQMEVQPARIAEFNVLEQVAARAEALGRQAAFHDWAQRKLLGAKDAGTRAALHWVLKDYKACAHDLAEQWKGVDPRSVGHLLTMWVDRFHKVGNDEACTQLTAAVDADAKNAQVRKPLDLTSHIDGPPAVAASANVLALARDDKYVYVGHTWGVEVYDPTGEPVRRIALGEPVEALASAGGAVWAGTWGGLFRIEPGAWAVARLALPSSVESHDRSRPEQKNNRSDRVTILAADGDELWIGWIRNLQRLNTRTMTVRAFSPRELNGHHWVGAGQDFAGAGQIVPDGECVWAADRDTLLRYESAADSWEIVQFEQRPLSFIGMIDGKLWGNARAGRPARLPPGDHRPANIEGYAAFG